MVIGGAFAERDVMEAECLKIARRILGEIQYVTIRRLRPKGAAPNWKVADIVPQPSPMVSGEIRDKLVSLADKYLLKRTRSADGKCPIKVCDIACRARAPSASITGPAAGSVLYFSILYLQWGAGSRKPASPAHSNWLQF